MSIIIVGLIFLIAIVLQTTLFNYLAIAGVKPDLLLIIVVYLGINRGALTGEIAGFIGGFLEDIFSGSLIGVNALVKTIIGNIVALGRGKLVFEYLVTQAAMTFLATLISAVLLLLVKIIFVSQGISYSGIIRNALIASFYNSVLSIFIFRLLDKMHLGNE